MGWPSCFAVDSPAVLAVLSDGYVGFACCAEYSLEFLFGAAMLIASLAVENTRLFILLEMVQGDFLC